MLVKDLNNRKMVVMFYVKVVVGGLLRGRLFRGIFFCGGIYIALYWEGINSVMLMNYPVHSLCLANSFNMILLFQINK